MKRLFCLFGFIFFVCGPTSLSQAVVDRIVAVVNQEIITLSELEKWIDPLKERIVAEDRLEKQEQMQVLCRQVLDRLIEEKLVDQEVKKSGIKISSKEIEAVVEEVRRRNRVTLEDLEKAVAAQGLTMEAYRKQLEKHLQRQRLIQRSVKVEKKAEEKDLREFYQMNISRYRTNETFRPGQILFVIPKEATPEQIREIRKKCQRVLERIKKGEDFGEVALLYSEDAANKHHGDLGYFKKGELLPVLEREALRLKVGEVSGIIRTEFGFHIIKLLDRKGVEPPPFEEVIERVKADYHDGEMEKAYQEYMSSLKERAIIEIKL